MTLKRDLSNIPGWRTNRRIVVFESDDWGSIRMPSLTAYHKLKEAQLDLDSWDAKRYNTNDSLATSEDLFCLFEILSSYKDRAGNSAVFTPISIVANPDFEKILENGFKEYYWEPFTKTLSRSRGCENSFSFWLEGIRNKIFVPQMHGREHLNVPAWLNALRKGDPQTLMAFKEKMWGFVPDQNIFPGIDFQAAFQFLDPIELEFHKKVIQEGLDIFEKLFGYRAVYFVPPNGPFNNSLNSTLVENGIQFRAVAKIQREPMGHNKFRKSLHWLGQKDGNGIRYIIRNCFFEPSLPGKDWIGSCMNEINSAFKWHKPAIISTHRVNYTGALNPVNRSLGLKQLNVLLQSILNEWPETEFMTSAGLGSIMSENNPQ